MIFVDSSTWIAAIRKDDARHAQAEARLQSALGNREQMLITDHILDETLTYLKKREGTQKAAAAGKTLLNSEGVRIEYGTPSRTNDALELLGKIDGLSFCDALSVVVMQELEVRTIYSLDSDFDKIKGIRRIE